MEWEPNKFFRANMGLKTMLSSLTLSFGPLYGIQLAHGILHSVNLGWWEPLLLQKKRYKYFSPLFCGRLAFIWETWLNQMAVMRDVVTNFFESSRQWVSQVKTLVFFLKNVPHYLKILGLNTRILWDCRHGKILGHAYYLFHSYEENLLLYPWPYENKD